MKDGHIRREVKEWGVKGIRGRGGKGCGDKGKRRGGEGKEGGGGGRGRRGGGRVGA